MSQFHSTDKLDALFELSHHVLAVGCLVVSRCLFWEYFFQLHMKIVWSALNRNQKYMHFWWEFCNAEPSVDARRCVCKRIQWTRECMLLSMLNKIKAKWDSLVDRRLEYTPSDTEREWVSAGERTRVVQCKREHREFRKSFGECKRFSEQQQRV